MEERKYVTIKYEIDTEIYKAAQEKLSAIGFSVDQYCVLCMLKGGQVLHGNTSLRRDEIR